MLLESVCVAALSVGSAICIWKLLSLPSEHQQHQVYDDHYALLSTCFLITCSMGVVAVWSVKGPHACWHPRSSRSLSADTMTPSPYVTQCSQGEVVQRASMETTGVFNSDELPVAQSAAVHCVVHASCDDNDRAAPVAEPDALPELPNGMWNERLERQSSFVEMALSVHG